MAKRPYIKPENPAFYRLTVVGTERTSPNFVRVTFGGEDLHGYTPIGHDQWFRLFLPQKHQSEPRIPTATSKLWFAQYLAMSKDTKPIVRNYTTRAYRPADHAVFGGTTPEIDVDFVAHGDAGPASAWANSATPGEHVAILDEGGIYNPIEAPWQLLVGDESAVPAMLGILESAPRDLVAKVFLEVPTQADVQKVSVGDGVDIKWIVRSDPHDKPGVAALEAVKRAELPEGHPFAYLAGESGLPTGLRRHLVNDRQIPKSNVSFTGYWKAGKAAGQV